MFSLFKSRDAEIEKLKVRIFTMRVHQTLDSKRLSWLSKNYPDAYKVIVSKDNPVARIRRHEKERIMADIEEMLEPLK